MAPDGYTLIQTGVGQNAVAHGLDPKLGYDSMKDFIHIAQVHTGPNLLVVHPSTPFKTFKELVDYVRANPGKLNYGYTHAASGHMAMELLKQRGQRVPQGREGLQRLLHRRHPVPRRRPDDARPAGRPDPDDVHQPGRRAAARARPASCARWRAPACSATRCTPTCRPSHESGFPNFQALSWSGMSLIKGTPQPIVDKFEAAMRKIMTSAEIKQKLESVGFVVPPPGAQAYTQFVQERDRPVDQGDQDRRHQAGVKGPP